MSSESKRSMKEMKRGIQIAVVLPIIALATGCASTGAYLTNRGRDAADIVTATLGIGGGATARVGPLHAGLFYGEDRVGISHGDLAAHSLSPYSTGCIADSIWARTIDVVGIGSDSYYEHALYSIERGKGYQASGRIPCIYLVDSSASCPPWHFYTQLEVAVGLGPTLRLGFNPGELLDFILGWTTIDIFNDDSAKRKTSNKTQEGIGEELAKPSE